MNFNSFYAVAVTLMYERAAKNKCSQSLTQTLLMPLWEINLAREDMKMVIVDIMGQK